MRPSGGVVDWHSAVAYARWAGKALPTEEQWEKGARGTDGRLYPWGNEWEWPRVNSAERHHGGDFNKVGEWWDWWNPIKDAKKSPGIFTSPVGAYASGASPYGLLDMAGNVYEWCDAWYDAYPGSQAQHEDFGRKYRVVRGGSWNQSSTSLRPAVPPTRDYMSGFVARALLSEMLISGILSSAFSVFLWGVWGFSPNISPRSGSLKIPQNAMLYRVVWLVKDNEDLP